MQCPYCDFEDTKVIDSRLSENKDAVRRRRECLSCEKRFTTYERREPLRLMVLKRDGGREPFDREKLRAGLAKACAKQRVTEDDIDLIVDEIEAELRERRRHEVTSRRLGDMVLVRLRKLDMVLTCGSPPCTGSTRTWTSSAPSSCASPARDRQRQVKANAKQYWG